MTQGELTTYSDCVAFYLKLYERPTFLQRNIRKVLSAHRRDLLKRREVRCAGKMAPYIGEMLPPPEGSRSTQAWNVAEIRKFLEDDTSSNPSPMLRIDITHIKERAAKFRDLELMDQQSFAPPSMRPVLASCSLTIWDFQQNTLVEQTRACEIHSSTTAEHGRNATVKLIAPFHVPLRSLKTTARPPGAGEMTYSTQFVLLSVDETTKWPPMDLQIPKPKDPRVRDQGSKFVRAPVLVAKWTRLPYLPDIERETLMEIKASQDGHIYKPKLSLKFNAEWVNVDSPLTKYNQELRSRNAKTNFPTAIESNMPKVRILTEWKFMGVIEYMPRVVMHGYVCPLCHGRRFRAAGEYHHHLVHSHELFEFAFLVTIYSNESGQSVESVIVQVEIADSHHALVALESRNLSWVRPQRPLDLEAYLNGDLTWVNNRPEPVSQSKAAESRTERSSSREQNRSELKNGRKRAIEDIPEIIITNKRKFKVPPAPNGFRFYSNFSKIPLVEGDEMSESDDDIAEDWLLQRHADTIDSFTDTLPEEKEFIHRFDRHMLKEDPCSDTHSEEALIRFCKQNRTWLRGAEMRFELAKKLTTLKINRLVSNDILLACLKIVNDESIIGETANAVPNSEATKKGLRSDGDVRRAFHLENDHTYGECRICWEIIYDKRQLQYCFNSACLFKSYHIQCAHKSQNSERVPIWLCEFCETRGVKLNSVPARAKISKPKLKSATSNVEVNGEANENAQPTNPKEPATSKADVNGDENRDRRLPHCEEPVTEPRLANSSTSATPSKIPKAIPSHLRSPAKPKKLQTPTKQGLLRPHSQTNGSAARNGKPSSRSKRTKKPKTIVIESDAEPWSNSSVQSGSEDADNEDTDARAREDDEYVERGGEGRSDGEESDF